MHKQDVEVNKVQVGDDGGLNEAIAIQHSDVCCNQAASVQTRRARGGKQCLPWLAIRGDDLM